LADRCSATSRDLGERLPGTASTVVNWLLVEQPGPWGRQALEHGRLPPAVGAFLRAQVAEHRFRAVLIRRHGRHEPDGIEVFAAHAGIRRRWLRRAHLPGPEALLDVDLAPLGAGEPPSIGEEDPRGVYLVCTHGRHDPCCSERGRPVAGILHRRFGDRVWEVSHVGGDRFAPNVVCLPAGVYLGRVDPDVAVGVIERFESGRLDLGRYRGRCAYDFVTQAAESMIREHSGADGIDDVVLVRRRRFPDGGVEAEFRTPHGPRTVRASVDHPGPARAITCRTPPTLPPVYRPA
jgi:hypothetical protein